MIYQKTAKLIDSVPASVSCIPKRIFTCSLLVPLLFLQNRTTRPCSQRQRISCIISFESVGPNSGVGAWEMPVSPWSGGALLCALGAAPGLEIFWKSFDPAASSRLAALPGAARGFLPLFTQYPGEQRQPERPRLGLSWSCDIAKHRTPSLS